MNTPILILAAGASTRMGRSKQMLVVDGEPLLVLAAKSALETGSEVFVVLGAHAEKHKILLSNFPVRAINHPEWNKGMGSSLKAGLKEVIAFVPKAAGVLIMLCDQPKVKGQHLNAILHKASQSTKEIIASSYHQTLGVPALFKKSLFPDLLLLGDEAGAAKLIRSHPEKVDSIEFPDGSIDLDTPDDVIRYAGKDRSQ